MSCGSNLDSVAMNPLRGVTLAGPEFGTQKPGFCAGDSGVFDRDYTWNSRQTVRWFASRGFGVFRIPFRWERMQPELGGALDVAEIRRLKKTVDWIESCGGEAILDLHNFGHYTFSTPNGPLEVALEQEVGGEKPLTAAHLADFWTRISVVFSNTAGVKAYGLMNEPHDLPDGAWKLCSQAAVSAIRKRGDKTAVLVAGDDWSNSELWEQANGPNSWIDDPANNFIYEAHCYFDYDASGEYKTGYDRELWLDPDLTKRPQTRLQPFINWCRRNHARGLMGEIGVPGHEKRWEPLLRDAIALLDMAEIPSCYWAAGEWWGDYPLSLQPRNDFTEQSSQMSWFLGGEGSKRP